MAIHRDDQGQTHRGLRCGDGNRKKRDQHAHRRFLLRAKTPESDKVQIRRSQHQFNANENKDGVPPAQSSQQTDGKQRRGNNEKRLKRRGHRLLPCLTAKCGGRPPSASGTTSFAPHCFSSITRTSAPISAAVSSTPVHCNGDTQPVINASPIRPTVSGGTRCATTETDSVLKIDHASVPNAATAITAPTQLKRRSFTASRRVSRIVKTINTATAPM